MTKKRTFVLVFMTAALMPLLALADGVNAGVTDPVVVPAPQAQAGNAPGQGRPLTLPGGFIEVPAVLPGSNQVGRPGVTPDQIGGYDVDIAYDHVAVGMAIVGVLFLMTEWMENR